jgi:hypothetical protein
VRRLVLLLVVLAVGCVKSSDVKTSTIKATYSAVAGDDGKLRCRASFAYTSNGFTNNAFVLTGSDRVVVQVDGVETPLKDTDGLLAVVDAPVSGSPIYFVLQRAGGVSVSSTVNLPLAFSLSSQQEGQSISLSTDAIQIDAAPSAPSGQASTWSASGPCINPVNESPAEASGTSISSGLITTPTSNADATCTMSVTLFRTVSGTASASLASGSVISATQQRSMDFSVAP